MASGRPLAGLTSSTTAPQLSFPNFLDEMSDNPSEKNDRHGDTECGEFYACQESMEIEGVALFALVGAAGCERK